MMRVFNSCVWSLASLICLLSMLSNFHGKGVMASHNVHLRYQTNNVEKVKQVYRTGYHFQPKKNWMNGISFFFSYSHTLYLFLAKLLIIHPIFVISLTIQMFFFSNQSLKLN
ncbi:putative beta-fructofuranosidase [Helianthus debilis subsp. tardiflorus]